MFCGRGHDLVNAEAADTVGSDAKSSSGRCRGTCQPAPRQLGTPGGAGQPLRGLDDRDAFQSGRLIEGGAALIGWAASRDAGRTWRRGFLEYPGRVSDPVVAYDERRKTG